MVLCGLPYNPTTETRIIREARLGGGYTVTVVFGAGLSAEMPYGSDRTLLCRMVDKAIKSQSAFVSWETATEFLRDLRMVNSGKNRADLSLPVERLFVAQPNLAAPFLRRLACIRSSFPFYQLDAFTAPTSMR